MSPFLGGTFNTIMATSFTTHFVDHQIDDLLAFGCEKIIPFERHFDTQLLKVDPRKQFNTERCYCLSQY